MSQKSVMILGAGMSGLCAAKRALERDFQVTVYERADQLGGLWYCKDDEDHYCMYDGLKSNQPKQIMVYPDCPYPQEDQWYFSAHEVHEYLMDYARKFSVDKVIKFNRQVIEIRPGKEKAWEVTENDLQLNMQEKRSFDFVAICNGRYNDPRTIAIPGQEVFQGQQIHSVKYRKAEKFRGSSMISLCLIVFI